jgi:hypothetical protein
MKYKPGDLIEYHGDIGLILYNQNSNYTILWDYNTVTDRTAILWIDEYTILVTDIFREEFK